ncbi:MAG: hypothetical protein LAT84_11705 [Balneolia bacterium]|nr:hypothetical protein [Balneolia bacterium]
MRTIGFKTAVITFLITFAAVSLALFAFRPVASAEFVLIAGFSGLITSVGVFAYSYNAYGRRIRRLRKLMEAVSAKKFDDLPQVDTESRDELSRLSTEVIGAARVMEAEYRRLMMLENYRKDFIGDVSHELKTPIFAIQGYVETLIDGALEDEEVNRHFLQKTMKNVNRLTILTNDLMEIAKLETGELKSHILPIYVADIVQEALDTLQYRAEEDGVAIHQEIPNDQFRVMGDRNQIRQVMVNLLENAIKYNKPGGAVNIKVSDQDGRVMVSVSDTGIGIAEEDIKRVTERFFRVDKSRSRGRGGTGLGLSIVKHILESHGSSINVKSVLGEGTTFSFSLKRAEKVSA